jgi:hypothetical protein
MTDKQKYWIADAAGNHAVVAGATARDEWTKVHGWAESAEPGPQDQVWVTNGDGLRGGRLPYAALQDSHWAGLGFVPDAPPEPVNLTKDPALTDQPAKAAPVAEPEKPTTKTAAPATSGDKKE